MSIADDAQNQTPAYSYPAYRVKYESVDGLIFPATKKPYLTCGEFFRIEQCPDYGQATINGLKHTSRVVKNHCDRAGCMTCSGEWARREATRCADRLHNGATAYYRHHHKLGFARHWAISPPQEWAKQLIKEKGMDGIFQIRRKATELAKRAGVFGGVVVAHPWRQDKQNKTWYLSPHIHIVGYGVMMHSDEFFKMSGGWIYNYKGVRKSIFKTISYLLSHAGISSDRHTLTYFGGFAYNKLKKNIKTIKKESAKCLTCGKNLIAYGLDEKGNIDYSNPYKPPKIKVEEVEYIVK
jgi:hypothetical protein